MASNTPTDTVFNLFALAINVGSFAAGVYALNCLWHWFAVPLGAPAIGYAHLFGLSLLLTLPGSARHVALVVEVTSPDADQSVKRLTAAICNVAAVALTLGVGYAAHVVANG